MAPLRSHLKRAARAAVRATTRHSGWLALRGTVDPRPRLRVLTYHHIRDCQSDPFSVSPTSFAQQMDWLSQRERCVSLTRVLAVREGAARAPDGAVLVTIDDGYGDAWSQAVPVLSSRGIPAVFFVPAGLIREAGTQPGDGTPEHMDWGQVRACVAAGFEVGAHGWSHTSMGVVSDADLWRETAHARHLVESAVGRPVRAFAYPYGTRADTGTLAGAAVRAAGYECAFSAQHGAIVGGEDPFLLPRVKVEGTDDLSAFRAIVDGAQDAWALVDRLLWRFQETPAASA